MSVAAGSQHVILNEPYAAGILPCNVTARVVYFGATELAPVLHVLEFEHILVGGGLRMRPLHIPALREDGGPAIGILITQGAGDISLPAPYLLWCCMETDGVNTALNAVYNGDSQCFGSMFLLRFRDATCSGFCDVGEIDEWLLALRLAMSCSHWTRYFTARPLSV